MEPASAQAQSVEWTQRAVVSPPQRVGHAMVYDSARGVTTLFGGYTDNDETWEWNGIAWTRRVVSGPTGRGFHAMAYDSARGVTVMFGGFSLGFLHNAETWEWNGIEWTQRMVGGPSPRHSHAMAYDSARGVTVLFGGYGPNADGMNTILGETWEWNGIEWTLRQVSGPSPRYVHEMAYDAARGVTVLFGGWADDGHDYNGETWEWNGIEWTQRAVSGPARRGYHGMAYDAGRAVTVLFGGSTDASNGTLDGETWEWDGTTWTERLIIGPTPRSGAEMAYDAARGVTVLFGDYAGDGGQTWELGTPCVAPAITAQPDAQTVCPSGSASFTVTATATLTYQWQWQPVSGAGWADLIDGLNLYPGVGEVEVQGATGFPLVVHAHGTGGSFRVHIANACGSMTSDEVTLTICPADFNCDGISNSGDFFDFLTAFFTTAPAADFNADGSINSQDFFDFLNSFFAGC